MKLEDGSQVIIVGGGPAGSFTALHMLHFASEIGLNLKITIFESRDFYRRGPRGCNKCAGVLSPMLVENLEKLALTIPDGVIVSHLKAYILSVDECELSIHAPDLKQQIYSVYRGSGPRLGEAPYPESFDGWLLSEAQARGAIVVHERVESIQAGLRPIIVTASGEYSADLAIVATGINSQIQLDPTWHYRPPRTERMAQDAIPLPLTAQSDKVYVFCEPPRGLVFGALVPKGKNANISLLGQHLPPDAITIFVKEHRLLDDSSLIAPFLCGCTSFVAVSPARNFFADRMVAVGDAAVTRLYKDGIGTAYITSMEAARTAVRQGIGRRDFARGYLPTCRAVVMDNLFGWVLFKLWIMMRRFPILLTAWENAILSENDLPPADQIHHRMLWGFLTGDESYRQFFKMLFSGKALWSVWRHFWKRDNHEK